MIKNPFFHRGPIHDPSYFSNRETEVKQTLEMLTNRQSVSIIGPRKIGKTSLLLHISRREVMQQYGLDPARHLIVYFNCEGLGELKLEEMFALILEEVAHRAAQQGHRLAIPERPISYPDFRRTFRKMSDSDEELSVALLLDEFEILSRNRELSNRLFPGLRALAQESVITYLTVSQRSLVDCSVEYSPIFNIFVPFRMGLFDESESREMMERSLSKAEITFLPEVLDGILELGGGHPFFLQVVGYWALELQATKGSPLESSDFYILTQTVRGQVEPHFEYYWKYLTPEERYVLAALPFTPSEKAYREQLETLATLCLIVKEDGQYRYFSPLFQDFVRRQKVPDILQADPLVLVLPPQRALLREEPLPLSPRQFALLSYLMERQGQVVSNEELDQKAMTLPEKRQEYKYVGDERLKSVIKGLRRALGDEKDCIVNKRGVGYVFQILTED